jgi:acyl dehydratase
VERVPDPRAPAATLVADPLTRTRLALYAGASGDHNPIHIDLDFARQAGMDDVFAHGMLGMAFLGRLLTQMFRPEQIRSWSVRFTAIIHVGDRLTCTATRIGNVPVGSGRHIELDLAVRDQNGELKIAGTAEIDDTSGRETR